MKNLNTVALGAIAAALLAACGAATPAPTKPVAPAATVAPAAPATTNVRVGYVPVSINYGFYVAVEKGYFKEQGLNVELLPTDGGSDAVVQVASGNFEASGSGISASMLNAVQRGIEFEIAASLHTERPKVASPLVVSKKRFDSGELTKVTDLKGKKVATNNRGTATEWWLNAALTKAGLDIKDVEVVGMPFPNIAPALENGSLDGAILTEPFATAAEDKGLIKRLSEDFITDFYPTYVYYNKKWATENPRLAQGFVRAYLKAVRDLQGDKRYDPANLAILAKWTKTDVEVLKRIPLPYFDPNGGVPIDNIMTLQTFYRKQGLITYPTDLDMNKYVNRAYVETALKEMGKVDMK